MAAVTGEPEMDARVEASPRSQQRLRAVVRVKLNHRTAGRRIPEMMAGVNRLLRDWNGCYQWAVWPVVVSGAGDVEGACGGELNALE